MRIKKKAKFIKVVNSWIRLDDIVSFTHKKYIDSPYWYVSLVMKGETFIYDLKIQCLNENVAKHFIKKLNNEFDLKIVEL